MPRPQSQKSTTSCSSQITLVLSTPQKPPTPLAKPDSYDVIAYNHIKVQPGEDVDAIAKETLRRAIESAGRGAAGERMTYGNQEGREVLEEKHKMNDMLKRMEDLMVNNQAEIKGLKDWMANKDIQIADHQAQIVDHQAQIVDYRAQIVSLQVENADNQAEIADLQYRVKSLTKDAKGYRTIRHRFIDFYCRDVLKNVDQKGHDRIYEGNKAAHKGDAITDATLYTTREREDENVLRDLYGLNANKISVLSDAGDYPSITVLNAGANWKVDGPANIPADVTAALQTFTTELMVNLEQGLTNQSLTGNTTALGRAYNAFWLAHRRGQRLKRQRVTM